MFRIANMDENKPLARYLSPIVTKTVLTALNRWAGTDEETEAMYDYYFSSDSPYSDTPFFEDVSRYITLNKVSDKIVPIYGNKEPDDDKVGREIILRKLNRMKEKLKDPDHYYTFDIFEEYLFSILIDTMRNLEFSRELGLDDLDEDVLEDMANLLEDLVSGEELPEELEEYLTSALDEEPAFGGDDGSDDEEPWELTDEEEISAAELESCFGLDEVTARITAIQTHRIEEMPLFDEEEDYYDDFDDYSDDETEEEPEGRLPNLFFWDDDYTMIFSDGFVEGIRRLASPSGTILGYDYDYVTDIFTDIGIEPPLELIGTRAEAEARNEAAEERWRKEVDSIMPDMSDRPEFGSIPDGIDDDELPFS